MPSFPNRPCHPKPGWFSPRGVRRAGFSLIEMLVAVAVVMILVAMMFQVFSRYQSILDTEVCKQNMREQWMGFMAYKNDHDGRIYDFDMMTENERANRARALVNTYPTYNVWGRLIMDHRDTREGGYVRWRPGLGPRPEGGNQTRRMPYCPGYETTASFMYTNYFGHAIPRSLLLYGQYLDLVPGRLVEGHYTPGLDRFVFLIDGDYPITSTIGRQTNVWRTGMGRGISYHAVERRLHGASADSLNMLAADGSAHTLRPPNPEDRNGGYQWATFSHTMRQFAGNRDSFILAVNDSFIELWPYADQLHLIPD